MHLAVFIPVANVDTGTTIGRAIGGSVDILEGDLVNIPPEYFQVPGAHVIVKDLEWVERKRLSGHLAPKIGPVAASATWKRESWRHSKRKKLGIWILYQQVATP